MRVKGIEQALLLMALTASCIACDSTLRASSDRTRPDETLQQPISLHMQKQTSADKLMREAESLIKRKPSSSDGYNLLCAAYIQKARETGDFGFNVRAESALNRSFEIEPDNYEAIKLRASLLLAYHRFGEALEEGRRAQRLRPNDATVYGILTDALVELGDYDQALEALQKMLSLRPDTSSYARLSYLRALFGNTHGAIEAMRAAVVSADSRDLESIAWCRVHLGDELMNAGEVAEAEREYDLALQAFPEYHLALAAKARARIAASDFDSAIEFYKRAQQRVPLPDIVIALGELYSKLGRQQEAKRQYDLLEFIEKASSKTYSRQLVLFWANHDRKLDEALAMARSERASRSDIYTCDALAWCLFKKGRLSQAKTSIGEAMRLGTRDPLIHYHAGMIYAATGDRQNAVKHLKLALEINPFFDLLQAEVAEQTLMKMK
jgi:tetratricopeptide (TPR) repeat protein